MVKISSQANFQINANPTAQQLNPSQTATVPGLHDPSALTLSPTQPPQVHTRNPAPHITGRSAPHCPAAQHAPPGQQ